MHEAEPAKTVLPALTGLPALSFSEFMHFVKKTTDSRMIISVIAENRYFKMSLILNLFAGQLSGFGKSINLKGLNNYCQPFWLCSLLYEKNL